MKNEVKTLSDAIRYFSDEYVCIRIVSEMRWPDGPVCPVCGSAADRQHFLKTQKRFQCRDCGKQYSVKVGTIFEDSAIKLDKWLTAMWLLANCKNGISSYEIAKDIGVTQKSAWFMLHRIREAMRCGSIMKMGGNGPIEVDETFVGGDPRKMHKDRRLTLQRRRNKTADWKAGEHYLGKTAVMGMLDRESRQIRAKVMPNVKRETLQNEILNQIEKGSKVYTDSATSYYSLPAQQYIHETVNHVSEYVRGQVHTQGIENFWSLLKRGLRGTYVAVEPFHLDRYVTEQVFRYNNRNTKDNPLSDADRFMLALSQISGKRLTYADLTGKVDVPQF
jgi:transposase-like protein